MATRSYNRAWSRQDEVIPGSYSVDSLVEFGFGPIEIPSGATLRLPFPLDVSQITDFFLLASQAMRLNVNGENEVQTVTITGLPTGGSLTLTYSGQTTAAIAWNATASAVQLALEALSNIGEGDVLVTGGPWPATAMTVQFRRALGCTNVSQLTSSSSLTGGTSPAIGHATTTAGSAASQTIDLPAGVPLDWLAIEAAYRGNPLTADWTHCLLSNDSGAPGTATFRGGMNP